MTSEYTTNALFGSIFEKGKDIILTTPYHENDLMVLLDAKDENITFDLYRYLYDPAEPELRLIQSISRGSEIKSSLGETLVVEILMPGRDRGELVVVSETGEVWSAQQKKNNIILNKKIGCINPDRSKNESLSFFEVFEVENLVLYFTKRTRDFAGLVVEELNNRFCILLNTDLFTEIDDDGVIIEFEDSKVFFNSEEKNLDLFSFNNESGLSYINFPVNRKSFPNPISITNLTMVRTPPDDICVIEETGYIISQQTLHIWPNFKKSKKIYQLKLPKTPDIVWFEPQHKMCKLIMDKSFYYFVLYPTLTEVNYKQLSHSGMKHFKFRDNDFRIKTLGNKQVSLILSDNYCYLWFKREHPKSIKRHDLVFLEVKNPRPDVIRSLQKLKDLDLLNFEAQLAIAEAGLPKALQIRAQSHRWFSKEEDIYIITHAYHDLTFPQIAQYLRRSVSAVYIHLKSIFGSPSCEDHAKFEQDCATCQETRSVWEKISMEKINTTRRYRDSENLIIDKEEFDYEKYRKRRKIAQIKHQIYDFQKLLPRKMYDAVLDFLLEEDLWRGRSVSKLFSQAIRLFITDHLNSISLEAYDYPVHLLDIYFSIRPETKTLFLFLKDYKAKINPDYHSLSTVKVIFYQDVLFLERIFDHGFCCSIYPILMAFYRDLETITTLKEGYLTGLFYLCFIDSTRYLSQRKLSSLYGLTEVTLRSRIKEIKRNPDLMKHVEIFKEILDTPEFFESCLFKN